MQLRLFLMPCLALVTLALPAAAAPDEAQLGKGAGYPIGGRANWFYDEGVRVGSFSNLDRLLPHNTLNKAATPLPLPPAANPPDIEYRFENRTLKLDDFLAHQRVTGLLLIKDGEVLFERYQYDRTSAHRFVSHSMAKSITSIAVGMALAEGKIASLDDTVAKYVPKLAGVPYGETSIRNVLRMSSGVAFKEVYDGNDDLARFARIRVREGSIEALREFRDRETEQGARRLQPDGDPGRAVARGDGDHAQRVSDRPAVATHGGGSQRDMGQESRRHRNRVGKLQCNLARLRTARHAAGQ